jgi:hypothetical protein
MIVKFKSVIFAVLLGSFITLPNIVKANDHDSVRNEVLLAKGTEVEFANFANKNAKRLVKSDNWTIFTKVVTLYNSSPAKLMAMNAEDKVAFNSAVKEIEAKLAKSKNNEAKIWKRKVNVTAGVINYLWNFKVEPTEDNEIVEIEALGK